MQLSFRWFGTNDPVKIENIAQIPGMYGIVSALYDVEVGEIWPSEKIKSLMQMVHQHGLALEVIESVPVHEEIKLGLPSRDHWIENYKKTLINLSQVGIKTVCYNFMPVFDWTRSTLTKQLKDGSFTLSYQHEDILKMDPSAGELDLPGWATDYSPNKLKELLKAYSELNEEGLWENLTHFLKEIIPVAESHGIKMAIHPDDPPWSIFGLPRIIRNREGLERLINIVDSPSNGLAICTGSLGADPHNDLVEIVGHFTALDRLNFLHMRNVLVHGERNFDEVAHPSKYGSLDMYEIMKAAITNGFDGPIRPDHGRMIWGETGKPGYGLYDRALGATYLYGLMEAIQKGSVRS